MWRPSGATLCPPRGVSCAETRAVPRLVRRRTAVGALVLCAACAYAGVRGWVRATALPEARMLEFRPSADHDAVDRQGAPMVQRYVFEVYPAGAATPVEKIDLGKPSPSADGVIRVDLSSLPMRPLAPGVQYEAAIVAVGPYGLGGSDRSNRFTFAQSGT